MSHLINYDFTLVLVKHSGFINLGFHNFFLQNTTMTLGARMRPYSYMYCILYRDGALHFSSLNIVINFLYYTLANLDLMMLYNFKYIYCYIL